jgi:adenylosuccinate lyase
MPDLVALIDPSTFTGRSAQLVEKLVATKVATALEKYKDALEGLQNAELKV